MGRDGDASFAPQANLGIFWIIISTVSWSWRILVIIDFYEIDTVEEQSSIYKERDRAGASLALLKCKESN